MELPTDFLSLGRGSVNFALDDSTDLFSQVGLLVNI